MDQIIRNSTMTGSRMPAIFDAHPFLTAFELWLRLKGGGVIDDAPDVRKILGQCLEPGLLDAYGRIMECEVIPNHETLRHPTHPLVAGTPDGWIKGTRIGVDAKAISPDQAKDWGREADDIPHYVVLQAYWYMLLMDFSEWIIIALVGGWLRFYTIVRDIEAEKVMLTRVEEWWERYIIGDEQPAMGASPEAARWLQRMHPMHHPPIRDATLEEAQLLDDYVVVRVAERKLATQRDTFENLIKQAIGDDEGLRWGARGRFTWRKPKDSLVVDWKSMGLGLLHEFVKDEQIRAVRLDFFTHPKPNVRRIHISHPSLAEAMEVAKEVAV
jgi:predicted phage-related endonuclease